MSQLREKYLPMNVITKSSERKGMRLKKLFFTFVAIGLVLLFVNYYFPSLQNFYEVSKNYIYVRNSSSISILENSSAQEQALDEHDVETLTPINRFNNSTAATLPLSTKTESKIWHNSCNLTDIDPWDSSILGYIKPEKDHMHDCVPKIFQHSKLINGQLFIYSKESFAREINCQMRCLFPKGDWDIIFGNWMTIINGTKPECDVVEVKCHESNYKFLHAQTYRNTTTLPPSSLLPQPPKKFDVHIIVLDSVAHTQFIRSMPKTLHMLRDQYEAIPFSHLNKINIHSYPNGFAFLLGKTLSSIPKSLFSRGHPNDFFGKDMIQVCKIPLDQEQFIGFRFQDDGYITMMAEDWANGVFNWPDCKGFIKAPTDHYMRPFQLRIEKIGAQPKYMAQTILKDSCRDHHHHIMNYLKNFLKTYPDKPKFSISWMSMLTHDDQNALSSTDDFFYRFFNDAKEKFENSFLFVMGDHGLRFGASRETVVGEIEDNNPALFLSIPKPLRNDPTLLQQLRKNSKELITHYDIYATLNEIAQPKNPRISNPILHGSSLFHPLPYPRTCDSLRIPFEHCNCRAKKTILPKNSKIGITAAKLMVEQMNFNLSTSDQTSKVCSKLHLDKSANVIVDDYGGEHNIRIYQITFSTLPGKGKFWGFASYDSSNHKFEIVSTLFPRLNQYADQTKCIHQSPLISYCYCKDQKFSVKA